MSRLRKLIIFSAAGLLLLITSYNLWAYQGTLLGPFIRNSATDDPHKELAVVLEDLGILKPVPDLWLEVLKTTHTLNMYSGETLIKSYKIALSRDYRLDKEKAGDGRTPEGDFLISEKEELRPARRFYGSRFLRLDYPSEEDALRGLREGLITGKDFLAVSKAHENGETPPQDTPLGGNIAIHGGGGPLMGISWTNGSIGMYSKDIEELYEYVPVGTRIVIKK